MPKEVFTQSLLDEQTLLTTIAKMATLSQRFPIGDSFYDGYANEILWLIAIKWEVEKLLTQLKEDQTDTAIAQDLVAVVSKLEKLQGHLGVDSENSSNLFRVLGIGDLKNSAVGLAEDAGFFKGGVTVDEIFQNPRVEMFVAENDIWSLLVQDVDDPAAITTEFVAAMDAFALTNDFGDLVATQRFMSKLMQQLVVKYSEASIIAEVKTTDPDQSVFYNSDPGGCEVFTYEEGVLTRTDRTDRAVQEERIEEFISDLPPEQPNVAETRGALIEVLRSSDSRREKAAKLFQIYNGNHLDRQVPWTAFSKIQEKMNELIGISTDSDNIGDAIYDYLTKLEPIGPGRFITDAVPITEDTIVILTSGGANQLPESMLARVIQQVDGDMEEVGRLVSQLVRHINERIEGYDPSGISAITEIPDEELAEFVRSRSGVPLDSPGVALTRLNKGAF